MKKWYIVQIVAILLFAILCVGTNYQKNRLYDQNAADRWGEGMAQISVIYPVSDRPQDEMFFLQLAHDLEDKLEKSSVADEIYPDKDTGLAFVQSLCVEGTVSIVSDNGNITADAVGVGEDFFLFHPIELIEGSYIDRDDLMKDGILIDEMCAWDLFGGTDVVGKQVEIGKVSHYIKGVFRKPEDRFSKEAGLDRAMCFVSMDSLNKYGKVSGSYDFEVILPNPVDGFADRLVEETLGNETARLYIINNSSRFDAGSIWDVLTDFGVRSMNGKATIFPYFENTARAWEDVFAVLLILKVICIVVAAVIVVAEIKLFRQSALYKKIKSYKLRDIFNKLKERHYEKKNFRSDAGNGNGSSHGSMRKKRKHRRTE